MSVRLYHRTTGDGAESIPRDGFRDGEDGGVWFSRFLDCWGERGRHLLVVSLDVTEEELAGWAHEAVADEVWDEGLGDFVKTDKPEEVERFVWYKIPAAVVNARGRVRREGAGRPQR